MTSAPTPSPDLRRQSAQLRDWCTFAVVILIVVLIGRHLLTPVIAIARGDDRDALEIANGLLRELARAGPAIFYTCALWALRGVFARLAGGATFEPAVIRGLGQVGGDLGWGAASAILLTPLILDWTDERPGGFALELEVASVVLGLLGCALGLLARLLSRAAVQEDDLRHII